MPTTRRSKGGMTSPPAPKAAPTLNETLPIQDEGNTSLTWVALSLLSALLLGALASFSLAPSLLVSASSIPSTNIQNNDGSCTTKPADIIYLQPPSTTQDTIVLPPSWISAGKGRQQFALAQACAAAFTITYESINIDEPITLTAATPMLSTTGKMHFFQNSGAQPKDMRLRASWQIQAQKVHLRQSAQVVNQAQFLTIYSKTPTFSASFIVKYKLTTSSAGTRTIQYKQLIVLLQSAPVTPSDTSTGWQVVDWYNGI